MTGDLARRQTSLPISCGVERYHKVEISSEAARVMNTLMDDVFQKLVFEVAKMARYNKNATLTARELETAVKLILPSDLASYAIGEGSRALQRFHSNYKKK
ncbi:hypothetical protein Mapa_011197 [Marchantia paleacea]|nr:hypothetical protein Mapa_011197 [Marchantia paleacea]